MSLLACLGPRCGWATDARALAWAGIDVLSLHRSPGSPVPSGWSVQLAHGRPFVGSGLIEDAVRVHRVSASRGLAFGWARARSPVHTQQDLSSVIQLRRATLHAGAGLRVVQRSFARYDTRATSEVSVGVGLRTSHASFVLRAIPRSITNGRARLDLGTRWTMRRPLSALIQHVREPGLPGRWRSAFWFTQHGLGLHGGYDVSSRAWAAGVEAGMRRTRWVYGVQNHPELGWSHVWMLELGSRRASH